jgi:hypothetical protein
MTKRTELEDELANQLDLARIKYDREVVAIKGRRFRWDFMVGEDLLIEVQGGLFIKGGHSTGVGISRDHEKHNLAMLAGYRDLLVNKETIKSGQALRWVQEAVK